MSAPLLEGYSALEKTAYVTAIASIATADQSASESEIAYLKNLTRSAELTEAETAQVLTAAAETNGQGLKAALDVLKNSELRFSLVTDLIAFAQSDNDLAQPEKTHISTIATYLEINPAQMEALNEYVRQTVTPPPALPLSGQAEGGLGSLLSGSGIGQKLQSSGINIGSLAKGLLSFVGPMILGNLLNKGMQGSKAPGGLNQGGLGSILGGLSGGKGFSGIGGLLSGLLK